MKKTLIAIVFSGAVVIAGCGSQTESKTQTTMKSSEAPARPSATTSTTISQDIMIEAYVAAMRDWFGAVLTRSEAITLGKTMCDTIDDYGNVSVTVDGIIASGRFVGMEGDVGYVMGVSIPVFCPEYEAEAKRLFR